MSKSALYTGLVLFGILLALAFVAWWVSDSANPPSAAEQSLLTQEGDTPFTDLSGADRSLDQYLNDYEYVLVTSWASWCPFCGEQLADLNTFAGRYPNQIAVLGINRKESTHQAERFLRTLEELPHLELVLDPDDRFFRNIEGYTIPETVLYNRAGDIIERKHGVLTASELEQWASELDL